MYDFRERSRFNKRRDICSNGEIVLRAPCETEIYRMNVHFLVRFLIKTYSDNMAIQQGLLGGTTSHARTDMMAEMYGNRGVPPLNLHGTVKTVRSMSVAFRASDCSLPLMR